LELRDKEESAFLDLAGPQDTNIPVPLNKEDLGSWIALAGAIENAKGNPV
jgi:hypothetical protein